MNSDSPQHIPKAEIEKRIGEIFSTSQFFLHFIIAYTLLALFDLSYMNLAMLIILTLLWYIVWRICRYVALGEERSLWQGIKNRISEVVQSG